MKYVCLVYCDEKMIEGMTPGDWSSLTGECMAYGERIRESGHFVAGEPLHFVKTATTVRVRNGKVTATDGPFAETKEQLAGFYLIEARDQDEAVELASRIPPARVGSIEVRPVRDIRERP